MQFSNITRLLPGLVLCTGGATFAVLFEHLQERFFGRAYLEAVVLAILIGASVRLAWRPSPRWQPGIRFSGKFLLEVAVMMLGASLNAPAVFAKGPDLMAAVALVVATSLLVGYGVSRLLGLPHKISVLIACGNSICGNSAIAAVASIVRAEGDDIAASISFTAALGLLVVLALPVWAHASGMPLERYGILAGLTVYAVPQVLAATAPIGVISVQMGTIVKLMRVLLLGPVIFAVSAWERLRMRSDRAPFETAGQSKVSFSRLVPWFIIGFAGLAAARSVGFIPLEAVLLLRAGATVLTIVSMAALGFDVDVRQLRRLGARAAVAVTISLGVLVVASLVAISLLG